MKKSDHFCSSSSRVVKTQHEKSTEPGFYYWPTEGKTDKETSEVLHTSVPTVQRARQRFVEGNLEYALNEQPRPGGQRKLAGKGEATLIALAKSEPPEGRKNWTLQLLADRLVELKVVDDVSHEMVRRELKKTTSSLG